MARVQANQKTTEEPTKSMLIHTKNYGMEVILQKGLFCVIA